MCDLSSFLPVLVSRGVVVGIALVVATWLHLEVMRSVIFSPCLWELWCSCGHSVGCCNVFCPCFCYLWYSSFGYSVSSCCHVEMRISRLSFLFLLAVV